MSDSCVLAIDFGTGGPKVALVTKAGHAIAWASEPVSTTLLGGGGAEQDPRQMWAAIVAATRTALTMTAPVPPIAAVAGEHRELRVLGDPLFNVALAAAADLPADETIDIFHVNDSLASKQWRMNGLQLPPAVHFCITRPNTQPGVMDRFAADLHEAVGYAREYRGTPPRSGATYGGGGAAVLRETVAAGMAGWLDATRALPPPRPQPPRPRPEPPAPANFVGLDMLSRSRPIQIGSDRLGLSSAGLAPANFVGLDMLSRSRRTRIGSSVYPTHRLTRRWPDAGN